MIYVVSQLYCLLVILPQLGQDGRRPELHPVGENDGLIERYSSGNLAGLMEMRNKQPVWSNETESYVLNFHGRVTRVSNLVTTVTPEVYYLTFPGLCEELPDCALL